MIVRESIEINAPADVVWRLVAHRFDEVGLWASDVAYSQRTQTHSVPEGATVGGRVCQSRYGAITEGFIHYDEAAMTFTYDAEGGAVPFFVRRTTNRWEVEATGENACAVSFQPEVEFVPIIGLLARFPMKLFMRQVLRKTLEELKHYMETGDVHPRKAQAMAKALAPVA